MAVLQMPQLQPAPSPERFFAAVNSYQITAAIRTALELDVFTAIHQGAVTPAQLAEKIGSDARRSRILCDFLAVEGFLAKQDGRYMLSPDSEMFLVRTSPAYMGGIVRFLLHADNLRKFDNLTAIMREGVSADDLRPENPFWVDFARTMEPLMRMPAEAIAGELRADRGEPWKVLDIAAGHGLFGITIARRNPKARIVAVDWPAVLDVARENAQQAGVADRYETLAGSAFDADFGAGYDVVLLTNFLHHFDPTENVRLLKKIHAAMKPGGRVVTLEFVPEEDRSGPPLAVKFAIIMMAGTLGGDAYTFSSYHQMFREAGFASSELVSLPGPESLVIAHR